MKGLFAALTRLSALPPKARSAAQAALRRAAASAENDAHAHAPVRTGALRASISVRLDQGKATLSARVPYAGAVESHTPYLVPAAKRAELARLAAQTFKEALK